MLPRDGDENEEEEEEDGEGTNDDEAEEEEMVDGEEGSSGSTALDKERGMERRASSTVT